MKVQDLLNDMEQRAFSSDFHDVIIDFYDHDTGYYTTSVEEDHRTATDRLSKILTAEQNNVITQIETLCTQNRQYAAIFGFKCGIYSALQQVFTNINYRDGGFDTYVAKSLLHLPGMKQHHKFYERYTKVNSLEKGIRDLLCDEDKDYTMYLCDAWHERIYNAALQGFYFGYRAGFAIVDNIDMLGSVHHISKILTTEYHLGYIHSYKELEHLQELKANANSNLEISSPLH